MKVTNKARVLAIAAGVMGLSALGATQVREILKLLGVGAVVQRFGPQINSAMNKLGSHDNTDISWTKVVPILSVGSRRAIGAAQVMGPRDRVDEVKAVAQLDQDLFGKEIKIRAMIPVASQELSNIHRVEGVGVSGIVDLRLKL
ncbi:MAG: hypothetical protein QOJ65_2235 [Fimbriimonadaceae bacterium]|jgi:hypothetical protein|nr:hypothetical protein [Fimbriimonadaceae bacterium]